MAAATAAETSFSAAQRGLKATTESEISKAFAEPCSKEFNQPNEKQVSQRFTDDCGDTYVLRIRPNWQRGHSFYRPAQRAFGGVGTRSEPCPDRSRKGGNH